MGARVSAPGAVACAIFLGLAVASCADVAPSPVPVTPASSSPSPSSTASGPPPVAATRIAVDQPTALALDGSTVWAVSGSDVARIDLPTRTVKTVATGIGGELQYVATTPGAVWVTDFDGALIRLDPTTGRIVARISVDHPEGVLPVGSSIWVANHHQGTVTVIDPRTNRATGTIKLGTAGSFGPYRLGAGAGSIWVDEANESQVVRIDPARASVLAKIPVPAEFGDCGGILATPAAVWVTGCGQTSDIVRIDPASNAVVAKFQLAWYGDDPVQVGDFVWVATSGLMGGPGELDRIDPGTNRIDRRLTVDALTDVAGSLVAGGDLWVANATDAVVGIQLSALATP